MPRNASEHQREMIRQLHREHGGDEVAICDAYARAEVGGRAFRKRGDYRLSPHDYAKAMLAHGREQGWLEPAGAG